MHLTMNLGDPSEARIYYLPHLVAEHRKHFKREGLSVSMIRTASGGHTVKGGQVPAVLSGAADLTIGGAMVTMKHAEEGVMLVNFCAAVRTNPWLVLGREPNPSFALEDLAHTRVIDISNVGTASFIFDQILAERNIKAERVAGEAGGGAAAWLAGHEPYAIEHLHAAAPALGQGRAHIMTTLAGPTSGVPWSTYIARPDVMAERADEFDAFRRAIAAALIDIGQLSADDLAVMVTGDFLDLDHDQRRTAIAVGKKAGLWPANTAIPQVDFDRFGALLIKAGWLTRMPDWAALTGRSA